MLVISAKSGQLGNRLLLFANFIAFAIKNNYKVVNPAFEEYAEFFHSTERNFLCCYPPLAFPLPSNKRLRSYYYQFNCYLSNSGLFKKINIPRDKPFNWSNSYNICQQINPHAINFFQGWLFRDGWFIEDIANLRQYADTIRTYFRPLPKYQSNIANLISKIRHHSDVIIGVHIRQGDYQSHQDGRYFYTVKQYVKVMETVKKLFANKKVTFLICSNENQTPDNFQNLSYVYGNNHIIEDMYSLAECDYIIGPPSTYTMWASFYGEKPLYMIRDVNKSLTIQDFVQFDQWQGIFYANEDWSKNSWEWIH
ncbi:hypothetical protein FJR11_03620 [Anabaena sp. UHCC 0187]|uniref:alpha-1,2-fucosyltransferase n=1 Tax=Anabaena sp. UHCC 0187 TaxID=2590018 RepID=UPI001446B68B|nr:alpha-1,2-fucosyltransferase [Anabaena sp. UHCC 0187]MTJ11702.1 hypothetical protein [Anabaena sp. UHCC 0187]